jgi:hypothetical protein
VPVTPELSAGAAQVSLHRASSTSRQYDAATYEYYEVPQTDGFYITFVHVHHFTKELLEAEASSDESSYKSKGEKCYESIVH